MTINVFIRQPFTESGEEEKRVIQGAMDVIQSMAEQFDLNFLVPPVAQEGATFKKNFEETQGKEFNPKNFRKYRLELLDKADIFINIRAGLSESSAFEIAYNVFGNKAPLFFAIWEKAPIKTTLIRDLEDCLDVVYVTFSDPKELEAPLKAFIENINHNNIGKLHGKIA